MFSRLKKKIFGKSRKKSEKSEKSREKVAEKVGKKVGKRSEKSTTSFALYWCSFILYVKEVS